MTSRHVKNYISSIMVPTDTMRLKVLLSRCDRAPAEAERFLRMYCHNVAGLESFLKENADDFFVENKRVTLYDLNLEMTREQAIRFFEAKLKEYGKPVNCDELKEHNIDKADEEVVAFISRFYPGNEIKRFFLSYPKVFVLHHDSVFLIEIETIRYFKNRLREFAGGKSLHFSKVRGHIGHAPPHVQAFVNKYYPGQEFQYFLENNKSVFKVNGHGNVTLVKR